MEKIYEENQNNEQKPKKEKKKIKIDGVTMLSFAVAIFAVVSLAAAGISSFSYALPSTVVELPDTFYGYENDDYVMRDRITEQQVFYHFYRSDGSSDAINYTYYDNSLSIPLLCLQRDVNYIPGNFNKTDSGVVSDDAGLLYLLANLAPNATINYPSGFNIPTGKKDQVDFWISQMAVWYYLNGSDNNKHDADKMNNAPQISWVYIGEDDDYALTQTTYSDTDHYFGYGDNSKKIFDEVKVGNLSINQLIANAKEKDGMTFGISLSDGEGVISTSEDKKYYFSPLYTVVPIVDESVGELLKYSLGVKAVDKDGKEVDLGAVITDESGEVINNIDDLKYSELSKFYVRIAAEKVSQDVTVQVTVNGTFKMYEGNRYVSGADSQEVTTIKFVNKTKSSGKDFDLAPAPDTGISVGQTIYFVGLIVLLCGVGIIYANARPQKVQE